MVIKNFKPFIGQHCETATVGTLLKNIGLDISEPMLFGLSEGLSYIFWNMKSMDFPFMGGRVKPDILTENLCRNLNLHLEVKETSSLKKAWANVENELKEGNVVGLKLDCYHLEYFNTKIHFAGHYAAMYGYDNEFAYLIDTDQQGGEVRTSLTNLELARNEKGPMSSKNKSFTIQPGSPKVDLNKQIRLAILNNAKAYLNPPIKNVSYKGIRKTADEVKKWFARSTNIKSEFQTSATLLERAGTGGALFRNLYRDFLAESSKRLQNPAISRAHEKFKDIASLWTDVSVLFHTIGETSDRKYVDEVFDILLDLSEKEKTAMEGLLENVNTA